MEFSNPNCLDKNCLDVALRFYIEHPIDTPSEVFKSGKYYACFANFFYRKAAVAPGDFLTRNSCLKIGPIFQACGIFAGLKLPGTNYRRVDSRFHGFQFQSDGHFYIRRGRGKCQRFANFLRTFDIMRVLASSALLATKGLSIQLRLVVHHSGGLLRTIRLRDK